MSDDPLLETSRELAALISRAAVCVYVRDRSGRLEELVDCFDGPLAKGWHRIAPPTRRAVDAFRQYALRGRDPRANRPVNTRELFGSAPDAMREFIESVLAPLGGWYQLRVAVYDRDQFVAWCGFIGSRADGEFSAREIRLLGSVSETLCDSIATVRALSRYTLGHDELGAVLDAFEEPAMLVSDGGRLRFANRRARNGYETMPPWLERIGKDPYSEEIEQLARCRRIDVDGKSCWLVLPRADGSTIARFRGAAPAIEDLPESLRRVASLIAEGLSDKEIATETCLSHATVRTYAGRLYRRLGVHGRSELCARLAASGQDPVGGFPRRSEANEAPGARGPRKDASRDSGEDP